MGCWGRGCHEKDSRGWYVAVSAPEFDPNPGGGGMGQIWVRTKNHPGAEKLWGGSLLSILAKKQCWLHSNCRNGDGRCWRCPTKSERKPQVIKPGVFGRGGHFRCPFPYIEFTFPPKYEKRLSEYLLQLYY